MKIIDLSHTIEENMPVYPGEEKSTIKQIAYVEKDGYNNHVLCTNMHTATHIDAPAHMLKNGKNITDFPAKHFIRNCFCINAIGKKIIDEDILKNIKNIKPTDALLICTGHDKNFAKDSYYKNFPTFTPLFAQKLIDLKISLFGFDGPGPDKYPHDIHKILFKNNILIIENLTNLEKLLDHNPFLLIALPIKISLGGAIARVVAQIR